MIRLGILGSTRGSSMLALIDAIKQEQLAAKIEIVISNKSNAPILSHAQLNFIPACFVNPYQVPRSEFDQSVSQLLHEYQIELVVLIGYMRILSSEFVQEWQHKIINVHPSLLPAHAGKMDLEVHASVLAAKEKISGCSVHYVTEDVDAGPVILQKSCAVYENDTPEELKKRVQTLEGLALIEAITLHHNRHS